MTAQAEVISNSVLLKLKEAGIAGLDEINPSPVKPLAVRDDCSEQAHAIPIDELPADFTDEQHAARNRLLPARPTRQQFLAGLVRGFNIRLAAEDFSPALTEEELDYKPSRTKLLSRLSSRLRLEHTERYKTSGGGLWWVVAQDIGYVVSMFRGSFALRAAAVFLTFEAAKLAAQAVTG